MKIEINSALKPNQSMLNSLATAMSEARENEIELAKIQAERKRDAQVMAQIERAGNIAKSRFVERKIEEKVIYYSSDWVRYPRLSHGSEAFEVQLHGVWHASRRLLGVPIKPTLSCVHLYTRLRDDISDAVSETGYPVLFKRDQPGIILENGLEAHLTPGDGGNSTTVEPGSPEWYEIDKILSLFEDSTNPAAS